MVVQIPSDNTVRKRGFQLDHSSDINLGLSEKVYSQLLEMITSGQYKPGDKMPSENELKDLLLTSRGTIRTALNRLRTLGIVETRHGGGSYIRSIDSSIYLNMMVPTILLEKNGLIDILEFRKAIEVQAAGLAAIMATEHENQQMLSLCKKMQQGAYNPEKQWAMNTALHARIVQASHNRLFISMEELIQNILTHEMKIFLINQGEDIDSDFYHKNIIECIVRRKPEEASFLMSQHDSLIISRIAAFNQSERPQAKSAAATPHSDAPES